jgi:hypothetical protein
MTLYTAKETKAKEQIRDGLLVRGHKVRGNADTQSSVEDCLNNPVITKSSKKDVIPSAPYPTAAQSDYIQNGLILPKNLKNLELLLRDVHQKGFLDLELLYQLKQKEEVRGIEKEIADRIVNPLEEGTPLFQRVFERCLSS